MKYKGQKITIKKIKSFLEGNAKFLLNEFDMLPKYYKEQVIWRASICKETCLANNDECEHCGCTASKKIYVEESCNEGKKFPDLMNKEKWEEYKKENNIEVYV
jgi:hypothetical protein